jgi:hypothetical protein
VAVTPHLVSRLAYDPLKDFAPVTLVVRNTTETTRFTGISSA